MESNEIVRMENTYTTQQLAGILDIGRSTLNKYSRSMEEADIRSLKVRTTRERTRSTTLKRYVNCSLSLA